MDWLLIGVVLCAFYLLGASRLASCVRAVAVQGSLLSVFPLFAKGCNDPHAIFLFGGTLIIKSVLIPLLLFRTIRAAAIRQEVEPSVSLHLSLIAGGLMVVVAFSSLKILPHPALPFSPLLIPSSLSMVLIGLFLLISRNKAVSQVLGFLVLENGIFLFGIMLVGRFPVTVELGILLDLLVAVFLMGIMVHHISRTFDHITPGAIPVPEGNE